MFLNNYIGKLLTRYHQWSLILEDREFERPSPRIYGEIFSPSRAQSTM